MKVYIQAASMQSLPKYTYLLNSVQRVLSIKAQWRDRSTWMRPLTWSCSVCSREIRMWSQIPQWEAECGKHATAPHYQSDCMAYLESLCSLPFMLSLTVKIFWQPYYINILFCINNYHVWNSPSQSLHSSLEFQPSSVAETLRSIFIS